MPKTDNEPAAGGFAMPLMRGFECPVDTPFMGQTSGPPQGIGCGWAKVDGEPAFFITMHAEGGFAMTARLDASMYRRFAENFAMIGRQGLISLAKDESDD